MSHSSQNSKFTLNPLILLLSILAVVILSRVMVFNQIYQQTPQSVQRGDTNRYEDPALHLLQHGSLAINPTDPRTTALSITPLYPLFIAGTYKIFGEKNRYALVILQILLSALTILIIYLIAQQLWSQKVALIASLLMALEPLTTLYSQIVLSETLFTFFLVSSLLAFIRFIKTTQFRWALLLGILLTATTMIRPISYYLVFAIILGIGIFKQRISLSWSQVLISALLILIPFLSVTSAWKARNENLTGVYVLNDAMSETLLYYKAKGVLIIQKSLSYEEAQQEILERLPSNIKTPKEQVAAESKLAKEIILGDIASYLKLTLQGLKAIIIGPGLTSQALFYDNKDKGKAENSSTGYKVWYLLLIAYGIAFMLFSYLLSAYGFFRSIQGATPQSSVIHLMMLGVVAYFILISTGHIATDSRMRVPIIPIFVLYASYGAYKVFDKFRKYNKK